MKILRNNLPGISIYFMIFVVISIVMTMAMTPRETGQFGREKFEIAFFAEEETPLVSGLREALADHVNFVPLNDETEKLQEALFYRRVHYILRVPEGFTASFLQGTPTRLQRTSVPDAASRIYIDLRIDRYLELMRLYAGVWPQLALSEQVTYALADLSRSVPVELAGPEGERDAQVRLQYFFNFMAYTMLFVIIIGASSIFLVFNRTEIKRRNLCSPLGPRAISLQCYMACIVFAAASWALLVATSMAFGWREITGMATWYYILNSFVFATCVTGLAYLVGNLTKNKEIVLAAANIVALGSSFIGGVFVPQELLGETVLKIASFTPTYWYVRANGAIAALTDFNLETLAGFFSALAVQLGFAAAFVVIALVAEKSRRTTL